MTSAAAVAAAFVPTLDRPLAAGDLAVLVDGGYELTVRITRVVHDVPYVQVIGLDTTAPFWGQELVTFWSRLRPAF